MDSKAARYKSMNGLGKSVGRDDAGDRCDVGGHFVRLPTFISANRLRDRSESGIAHFERGVGCVHAASDPSCRAPCRQSSRAAAGGGHDGRFKSVRRALRPRIFSIQAELAREAALARSRARARSGGAGLLTRRPLRQLRRRKTSRCRRNGKLPNPPTARLCRRLVPPSWKSRLTPQLLFAIQRSRAQRRRLPLPRPTTARSSRSFLVSRRIPALGPGLRSAMRRRKPAPSAGAPPSVRRRNRIPRRRSPPRLSESSAVGRSAGASSSSGRGFGFGSLFGLGRSSVSPTALGYDQYTAVYDLSAHTVYLPNGTKLEAHSGLGDRLDDPNHVNERMRGATPPHLYETRAAGGFVPRRAGLASKSHRRRRYFRPRRSTRPHLYAGPELGIPTAACRSRTTTDLRAYQNGEIRKLAVVARL